MLPSNSVKISEFSKVEILSHNDLRSFTFSVPNAAQLLLNLDPFRLLALPFGIAFHPQIVLLSYHPIVLLPYHFLKLVSFLGANRTKSASVGPRLFMGAIYMLEYLTMQLINTIFKYK